MATKGNNTQYKKHAAWYKLMLAIAPSLAFTVVNPSAARGTSWFREISELNPGLVVVLDPSDLVGLSGLPESRCLIDVLLRDSDEVQAGRLVVARSGLYGRMTVREYDGKNLPYADNLVNLIVAEAASQIPAQELVRVLAPRGLALISEQRNGDMLAGLPDVSRQGRSGLARYEKPVPSGMDDWTHYLYDASNNAVSRDALVGPPRSIQWVGNPRWTRHHDHIASVSAMACAAGRVFFINDGGSSLSIHLPPNWSLIARDAFNGNVLWTKDIPKWVNPLWPLKSGPATTPRRLVAMGDDLFVTLGLDEPVSLLSGKTGEVIQVFPETRFARELVVSEGTLVCVTASETADYGVYAPSRQRSPEEQRIVDERWGSRTQPRRIVAIEPQGGELLWQLESPVTALSLAVSSGRAFFHDGTRVHAIDLTSGTEIWTSEPVPKLAIRSPSYGCNLVATPEAVLFSGGNRKMTAMDALSGKVLWDAEHPPSGYRSPEDLFVIGGRVMAAGIRNIHPSSKGELTVHNLLTGKLKNVFPADTFGHFPHHRCYRSKATEKYILTSRTGIELLSTEDGTWQNHFWARGGCLVGLMPANGLTIIPPHHCACFASSKLVGFHALSSGSTSTRDIDDTSRLERGQAYERIRELRVDANQKDAWPMHRRDGKRSGCSPASVSHSLEDGWKVFVGGRLTSPVIAGGKAVVASIDVHTVQAFNANNGEMLWRFIAGGRIDSAPTLFQGRVLFGCADGWIYCLDAANGQLAWRFRAAPAERLHGAYEQLESVWPVHGSILIINDLIHAVAGRCRFTDGGLHIMRIDPFTGNKVSETIYDENSYWYGHELHRQFDRTYQSPEERKKNIAMAFQDVGITDILNVERGEVYMRRFPLAFDEKERSEAARPSPSSLCVTPGLLNPSWSHRTGWRRWPGPVSRLLVFDEEGRVFGFGFTVRYQVLNTFDHYLYGVSLNGKEAQNLWPSQNLPFFATAMALTEDMLLVAGPPDIGVIDNPEIYKRSSEPEFQEKLRRQNRLLAGDEGGVLWIIDKGDGRKLAEYALKHAPVFDGLAVAEGAVFFSTRDGHLKCMRPQVPSDPAA